MGQCPCFAGVAAGGSARAPEVAAPAAEAPAEPYYSPEPPKPPPRPAQTTPIVLETLQGQWVNSMGAKISVTGTAVSMNGTVMKMHPINLDEDGLVTSIGRIWQINGWMEDEKIEWKECPSREVMQFARSVVWTSATPEKMVEWTAQMKGLGYAGSAADPLHRGIEGCMAGSMDAKAKTSTAEANSAQQDQEDLATLNRLLSQWREPGVKNVPPRLVIPDFSNRGHTGLSVEHVHFLATQFKEKGFQNRVGNKGHDIPVLIHDQPTSELGKRAVTNWLEKLKDEPGFPPQAHYDTLFRGQEMYTSLGNGHFNQALNLFKNECDSIYNGQKYTIGGDTDLAYAVRTGVTALVLKNEIPLRDRETISKLLNSKREFKWDINEDGSLNILNAEEDTSNCKQFEALSKVLDAVELNCLVRAELQVKDSHRVGQ